MKEAISSSETLLLTETHGVTSQKTPFFIVTAVKTSNLTTNKKYYKIKLSLKQAVEVCNIVRI
jgi:hypothetical protein